MLHYEEVCILLDNYYKNCQIKTKQDAQKQKQ